MRDVWIVVVGLSDGISYSKTLLFMIIPGQGILFFVFSFIFGCNCQQTVADVSPRIQESPYFLIFNYPKITFYIV